MKNPSKGNNNKNEIELLLRKALRIKQKPSQELNDSIIRQYEKNTSTSYQRARHFRCRNNERVSNHNLFFT